MIEQSAKHWTRVGRSAVFVLSSTSIACLLAQLYRVCPMQYSAPLVFCPALGALAGYALRDRVNGEGQLYRAVWMGLAGGLLAAVAYDVFRLPFVFAQQWAIDSVIPPLNLFNVFPRFGAMILGQPIEQGSYSTAAHLVGWAYHFSNGATFGVMYVALVGNPARRGWWWAILFAVILELAMLVTPYPSVFNIPLTTRFVLVTTAAHAVFGVMLGWSIRLMHGATANPEV